MRPFCNLIIEQKNWVVEPLTEAVGREFAKLTFLGPFLCTSLFAEDDPSVCQLSNSPGGLMVSSLQQEIALTRNLLHQVCSISLNDRRLQGSLPIFFEANVKLSFLSRFFLKVFYALLANSGSREATLQWIALALKRNEKRSMINVESRLMAGDGFFLNLAAVMHQLSLKIKLDKVDFYYPFHPQSRLNILNETRIKVNSQEGQQWLEALNRPDSGHVWQVGSIFNSSQVPFD